MTFDPKTPPGGSKTPAAAKPTWQVIAETIVDALAIAGVILLAVLGKVGGELALLATLVLAGARITDLMAAKGGGGPSGPGTGGLTGLAVVIATHFASVLGRIGHAS